MHAPAPAPRSRKRRWRLKTWNGICELQIREPALSPSLSLGHSNILNMEHTPKSLKRRKARGGNVKPEGITTLMISNISPSHYLPDETGHITYGSDLDKKGCVERARGRTRDHMRSTQPFLTISEP